MIDWSKPHFIFRSNGETCFLWINNKTFMVERIAYARYCALFGYLLNKSIAYLRSKYIIEVFE
jgi:hypothetical protein